MASKVAEMEGGRRRFVGRGYRGANRGGRMARIGARRAENQLGAKAVMTSETNSPVADFLRAMFQLGGTEFVDRVVSSEEFEAHFKALAPSCRGNVLLEVGDEFFDSTLAISQYVAMRNGLVPEEPMRRLRTHMIYAVFDEAVQEAVQVKSNQDACCKDVCKQPCNETCKDICAAKSCCKDGSCQEKCCQEGSTGEGNSCKEGANAGCCKTGGTGQCPPSSGSGMSCKPSSLDKTAIRTCYLEKIQPKLKQTEKMLSQYMPPQRNPSSRAGGLDRYNLTYLDVAIGVFLKQLLVPLSASVTDLTPEQQINFTTCPIMFSIMSRVLELPKIKKLLMASQPKIKLTYFDAIGRAEPIRWALTLAGLEFEDKRITFDEWMEMKKFSPNGKVPILEIEGEGVFTESLAMMNWAAGQAGLIPQTEEANLHGLAVVQAIENCIQPIGQVRRAMVLAEQKAGSNKDAQATSGPSPMDELCEHVLPQLVSHVDSVVSRYQDAEGHVVGGRLSYVDLLVASTYLNLVHEQRIAWIRDPKMLCPSMQRCYKMVLQIQQIREFRSWPQAKPILYYFQVPGRAESLRFAMAVAGIEFEDKTFNAQDWTSIYKQASPSKQCPYLVVGKDVICETRAIHQWIGEKGGLIPDTLMGRIRADAIFTYFSENVWSAQSQLYPFAVGSPEREAAAKTVREVQLPPHWKFIDSYIKEGQDSEGYCVEGELSWIDLFIGGELSHCFCMNVMADDWRTQYPSIAKTYNLVHTKLPAVQEFLAKRGAPPAP